MTPEEYMDWSDWLDKEIAAEKARAVTEALAHVPYVAHLSDAEHES